MSTAGALQSVSAVADAQQYLTFSLSGEMFAIGILSVKEIIEYGGLTSVPMMPAAIRGVINLRGAVVPVIDLACVFGRTSSRITSRTCMVIVETEVDGNRQDVGIVVDAVSEVLEIRLDQIEPPPSFGACIRTDFLQGMARISNAFVILLNVQKVLAIDALSAPLAEASVAMAA